MTGAARAEMPADVATALDEAVSSDAASARQGALDGLLAWTKASQALPIDWSTLAGFDYAPDAEGSKTDATDPHSIRVTIGQNAFSCDGNLYSTFRHELVHVAQHQASLLDRVIERGWGIQEVEAYLWELDHAGETGLDRCDRRSGGGYDTKTGVARAMDGVFRYLVVLQTELAAGEAKIDADELARVSAHVACEIGRYREIAQAIFPELDVTQLPACAL